MSIWICKTVNKQERYVKLVEMVMIRTVIDPGHGRQLVDAQGVLLETMNGDRIVMDAGIFFTQHDRTEHVDFMEAFYGQ